MKFVLAEIETVTGPCRKALSMLLSLNFAKATYFSGFPTKGGVLPLRYLQVPFLIKQKC